MEEQIAARGRSGRRNEIKLVELVCLLFHSFLGRHVVGGFDHQETPSAKPEPGCRSAWRRAPADANAR